MIRPQHLARDLKSVIDAHLTRLGDTDSLESLAAVRETPDMGNEEWVPTRQFSDSFGHGVEMRTADGQRFRVIVTEVG